MTVAMLILYTTDNLQIWHLYLAQALTGAFGAFQLPAYLAATTMLVPKAEYARASGVRSLAESTARVLAPFFAGVMLIWVDMDGVMLIDVATFLIAIATLLVVRIPRPAITQDDLTSRGNAWREIGFGFRYIFQRHGLLGLLITFMSFNLFAALTYYAILPAMILARSGSDGLALASVQSTLGIGGIVGGLSLSICGGPKRRIHGVLAGAAFSFLLGDSLFAVGRGVPIWVTAAFLASFFIPFITGTNRAIWQAKVAPSVQGRVFSVQDMFQQATMPLGYLLAGLLADRLFEPAMAAGGSLVGVFGWLVGTGPGAGMALMFACTAILGTAVSVSGYLFQAVRHVEDELPDYEVVSTPRPV
jgi:predicted MFS family arabinose efflux permease